MKSAPLLAAAAEVRKLQAVFQGIDLIAQAFEKLGNYEQAIEEAQARLEKARAAETAFASQADEIRGSAEAVRAQAEADAIALKTGAQALLDKARAAAQRTKDEADAYAVAAHQQIEDLKAEIKDLGKQVEAQREELKQAVAERTRVEREIVNAKNALIAKLGAA